MVQSGGEFCTSELVVDSEKPSDTNHQWLRTKVMSSITFPGFCVKSSFQARAYTDRDAVTDGHANPGPCPNRNANTCTRAHGDGYPCARAYSDPNGNAGTDARAHGDEQPYARANGDRNSNTYADASPKRSHVAGNHCSVRGPMLGLRSGRLPLLAVG